MQSVSSLRFSRGLSLPWASTSRSHPSLRTYAAPTDVIKSAVESNKVTVFSKVYCPYCTDVKKLLSKDLKVDIKCLELDNMGAEGGAIQAALLPITGSRTVPQVFVGGKYIGGCTDTQDLHSKGELVPMLKEVGAL